MSGAPLLEARGLVRRFGAAVAVDGIDLTLTEGEVLVVVGPNGAGKSTLLRLLAGLARPTRGTVHVCGRPLVAGDPAARAPIGLVGHRSFLYDDLTLRENLAFAAELHGLPAPWRSADAGLAEVGLEGRATSRPRDLSRGMLQRASIARALLPLPRVLLLDEPFTGLDAASAEGVAALLRDRVAAGAGVLVVTHQPAEVWGLATRCAALVRGRWVLDEPRGPDPEAYLARYRAAALAA